MSPQINNKGYRYLDLFDENTNRCSRTIHRLVTTQFLDKIAGKEQVNHKNGDKLDNRVSNLEWVSASEQIKHAWESGLFAGNRGKKLGEDGKYHYPEDEK